VEGGVGEMYEVGKGILGYGDGAEILKTLKIYIVCRY
jgi:hypothetical protein